MKLPTLHRGTVSVGNTPVRGGVVPAGCNDRCKDARDLCEGLYNTPDGKKKCASMWPACNASCNRLHRKQPSWCP